MLYSKKRVIKKAIPDNDTNGLRDTIEVVRDLTVKNVEVHVDIQHPYTGDISLELHGPNGLKKTFLNPSRTPGKNIVRSFNDEGFDIFNGIKSRGEWTLKVIDAGAKDNGVLNSWTLNLVMANSKKTEIFISDSADVKSTQVCHQGGRITDISAQVKIGHDHVGDLQVKLVSPDGKEVLLQNAQGGSAESLEKKYDSSELSAFIGDTAKGKWHLTIKDQMKGDSGHLVKWGLDIKTTNGKIKDDLTKIEGIGPKIQQLLNAADIYSFKELSNSTVNILKQILDDAGPRFQMHDPGSWPQQATLAANGNWDELQTLQDQLDGGR